MYNGQFVLRGVDEDRTGFRRVFVFRLERMDDARSPGGRQPNLKHTRVIPSSIKQEVWKRDGGRCRICGASDNLHFDHIVPFSKGGSSLVAENIQLLCARHNLAKRDNIEQAG